jgi:2-keto-4-pentenoate hydratase
MKLTASEHESLAARLHTAIRAGQRIGPLSETIDYTFEDAYRIRRRLVDKLIADGGKPRGHKIGFTSEAMQKMYGMSGPDFGILLDNMFMDAANPLKVSDLSDTRAEPELAFELARPLTGPGITIEQAIAACASVRAAIEVIDSRVGAMRAKAHDSLADNAGAGRVVIGRIAIDPTTLRLDEITMTMDVDGVSQSGITRDVMGHPAAPLAWLANKLPQLEGLGGRLKAGDIVITGAPVRSVAVKAGSKLHADFGPLGSLDIEFT